MVISENLSCFSILLTSITEILVVAVQRSRGGGSIPDRKCGSTAVSGCRALLPRVSVPPATTDSN